jgi:hypothetical protein
MMSVRQWVIASGLLCGLWAQANPSAPQAPEPVFDQQGHTQQKIEHRLSPDVYHQSPFGRPVFRQIYAPSSGSVSTITPSIGYHGGSVMPGLSKVVVIWYGNWAQNDGTDNATGQGIILDALYGLAQPSGYAGILTGANSTLGKYTQSSGATVTQMSSVTMEIHTVATSSTYGGSTLTDSSVLKLVKSVAGTGDSQAVYLVLSSSDISESSGFLTKYCGWHTHATVGSSNIKYAFIGNPNRNLAACAVQSTSPNGNAAVDAMISVIAHELAETVTDPNLNAWYNLNGAENGDMCAWTFGSNLTYTNGAYWNTTLPARATGSTRNYLLQRQLAPSTSKCYISATGPTQ